MALNAGGQVRQAGQLGSVPAVARSASEVRRLLEETELRILQQRLDLARTQRQIRELSCSKFPLSSLEGTGETSCPPLEAVEAQPEGKSNSAGSPTSPTRAEVLSLEGRVAEAAAVESSGIGTWAFKSAAAEEASEGEVGHVFVDMNCHVSSSLHVSLCDSSLNGGAAGASGPATQLTRWCQGPSPVIHVSELERLAWGLPLEGSAHPMSSGVPVHCFQAPLPQLAMPLGQARLNQKALLLSAWNNMTASPCPVNADANKDEPCGRSNVHDGEDFHCLGVPASAHPCELSTRVLVGRHTSDQQSLPKRSPRPNRRERRRHNLSFDIDFLSAEYYGAVPEAVTTPRSHSRSRRALLRDGNRDSSQGLYTTE